MTRKAVSIVLSLFWLLGLNTFAIAQTDNTTQKPLIVGTKIAPPFVMKDDLGQYTGLSIELWEMIADDLDLAFSYQETDVEGLLTGLQNKELDAAVAALTVTAEREAIVDFSHPFYSTGLGIAVLEKKGGVWQAVKRLVSWEFLAALGALAALLLIVGFALWLAERKKNEEQFGGAVTEGIGNSFWWAAVTMTTVGYGDKAPITLVGRLIALVWMFAAIIIISSFTAAIATSLTVGQLESSVKGIEDLPDVGVTTVAGTASETFLKQEGIGHRKRDNLEKALGDLTQGKTDAVVYDKPILLYLSNQEYPKRTEVLPDEFKRQDYGIGLPNNSPLREDINRALLKVISSDEWNEKLTQYFGANDG